MPSSLDLSSQNIYRCWVKFTIAAYYSIVSYVFITNKNKIDRQYENILPVPKAYWDKNIWVQTIRFVLFYCTVCVLCVITRYSLYPVVIPETLPILRCQYSFALPRALPLSTNPSE